MVEGAATVFDEWINNKFPPLISELDPMDIYNANDIWNLIPDHNHNFKDRIVVIQSQ